MSHDPNLEGLEIKISKFLRAGVLLAGLLLAVGWGLELGQGAGGIAELRGYHARALAEDLTVAWRAGRPGRLVVYAGLVLLIALPFTRVALTAVLFARRRERALAAAAAFVAIALVLSAWLGVEL